MDSHPLLIDYLTVLARRLPRATVDELADGYERSREPRRSPRPG